MLGLWLRPWPQEAVVGEVVAVSGSTLVCHSPGGVEFTVLLADVPKMAVYRPGYQLRNLMNGIGAGRVQRTGQRVPVARAAAN